MAKLKKPDFEWESAYGVGYIKLSKGKFKRSQLIEGKDGTWIVIDIGTKGEILGVEIVL